MRATINPTTDDHPRFPRLTMPPDYKTGDWRLLDYFTGQGGEGYQKTVDHLTPLPHRGRGGGEGDYKPSDLATIRLFHITAECKPVEV